MCKTSVWIQCTNFDPERYRLKKLDAFGAFGTKRLFGILFTLYVVVLKINQYFLMYLMYSGYGE